MIFMMQPGFALLEAGLGSPRNLANIMLKNLTTMAVSILVFGTFRFSVMFGAGGILPDALPSAATTFPQFELMPLSTVAITIFHVMFAGTATSIISGAVSGRDPVRRDGRRTDVERREAPGVPLRQAGGARTASDLSNGRRVAQRHPLLVKRRVNAIGSLRELIG
jgi:hypothetical protein